jgi:uncharacterized protein
MTSALVTGASSGIGAAFARRLAQQGHELTLVARHQDRLEALAAELEQRHGVFPEVLPADLARREDVARVEARVATLPDLAVLVNAAGFVTAGRFGQLPTERHLDMLRVHAEAPVRLTRAALAGLLDHRGTVVNVASIGAFLPTAGNATYAGTKAFLVAWTRALHLELRGTGVRVQALCPGFTRTGIYDTPELRALALGSKVPAFLWPRPTRSSTRRCGHSRATASCASPAGRRACSCWRAGPGCYRCSPPPWSARRSWTGSGAGAGRGVAGGTGSSGNPQARLRGPSAERATLGRGGTVDGTRHATRGARKGHTSP